MAEACCYAGFCASYLLECIGLASGSTCVDAAECCIRCFDTPARSADRCHSSSPAQELSPVH